MHTILMFTQPYCIETMKIPKFFDSCWIIIREWDNVLYKIFLMNILSDGDHRDRNV
jgi:hypothetical protein